jgi:hypothetical protein
VAVRRILSQRPGLRAATTDSGEEVVIDFAALLDLLADDEPEQHPRGQLSAVEEARLACAACGLRRLPSFRGTVYCPANLSSAGADAYQSGQTVVEPSFIITTSSPAISCNGNGEYVIWSETGKRVAALAVRARPDEVIFAPGTSFKVLQVDSARSAPRIFLRELPSHNPGSDAGPGPTPPAGTQWSPLDLRVLDQLARAATIRDDTPPDNETARRWPSTALPIGLDDQGVPFSTGAEFIGGGHEQGPPVQR